MFQVTREDATYDLQGVMDAVEWAYKRNQSEDEMYANRNTSPTIQWSPLTRLLEQAYAQLLEMRMWRTDWEPSDASTQTT